jgi:dienelactone hydrolase
MNSIFLSFMFFAPADSPPAVEDRAKTFVATLEQGKFTEAGADFDQTMRKVLPADKLEALWKAVIGKVGAFEKQLSVRSEPGDPYTIAYVRCKFAKATLDVKVVFDKERKISGLNFLPIDQYTAPTYVNQRTFHETRVKVGTGQWQLPGTLTMPNGDGPFPAVVLVHGSGPQDRDETIGQTKPFRDLAWGLATKGLAVLRYEKRTKEHGVKLVGSKTLTVKEETIDDALLAADLLRKTSGIDPKRVFIIGHSQGAMMAPRMALADQALAGIVMLAAPSRPLEDVMLEQTEAALKHRDKLSEGEVKLIEALFHIGKLIKEGKLTAETPSAELLGGTPDYWRSLCGFTMIPEAKRLKLPVLILQGENDVQVTMADFAGWKKALEDQKNVTLKSYAKLGHTFTPYEPAPGVREGDKPVHVAPEVVEDVAKWILGKK